MTNKELAKYEGISGYPALRSNGEYLARVLRENLQGGALTPFSLPRIKVGAAGNTNWQVQTLEGDDSVKELTGVIVHKQPSRGYWAKPYSETDKGPPQCQSWDGQFGIGDPGGECATCEFNKFGSASTKDVERRGKACPPKYFLFMLRPDDILPGIIQVPSTSVQEYDTFVLRLLGRYGNEVAEGEDAVDPQWFMSQFKIGLALKKETKSGYPTAILVPRLIEPLDSDDHERVIAACQNLAPLFQQAAQRFDEQDQYVS